MTKITANKARYIKLGEKGQWEELGLKDGTLRLQYFDVPHELGQRGDAKSIKQIYVNKGLAPKTAAEHARQVLAFYDPDPSTLWITFAHGCLWWAFAQPEVIYLGGDPVAQGSTGSRYRRTLNGWRNITLAGEEIRMAELNGALTKTAGYPMTICDLSREMLDYILNCINGNESTVKVKAAEVRDNAKQIMADLIQSLQANDFEIYVEMAFTKLGWQRMGALGGRQKTVDMNLYLPVTNQRGFAQVKSSTNQSELNAYVKALAGRSEDYMYYAYHTSPHPLVCTDPRVCLVGVKELADMGWRAGLL